MSFAYQGYTFDNQIMFVDSSAIQEEHRPESIGFEILLKQQDGFAPREGNTFGECKMRQDFPPLRRRSTQSGVTGNNHWSSVSRRCFCTPAEDSLLASGPMPQEGFGTAESYRNAHGLLW